jgi:thioredoxin 1
MKKIIRFTASWCMPCQAMAKQLETLDIKIPIDVVDIDVHPEIAVEYGIRSVPTLVMVEENNTILKRITGVKPPAELKEWIEK